jgi:hypothetical protein
VELAKSSRSREGEVELDVGSRRTHDRDLCVSAEHISEENEGGGRKTAEV